MLRILLFTFGLLIPQAQLLAATPQEIEAGRLHAQFYPVEVTGLLPPLEPVRKLLTRFFGPKSIEAIYSWVGLQPYPLEEDTGVYSVPYPGGVRPDHPIGLRFMERFGAQGATIGCAECHAGRLFGKTVLGMTNRFPRANRAFLNAKWMSGLVTAEFFQNVTGASEGEKELFAEAKRNLKAVGVKKPLQLGLDTSLAQVAMSLDRREENEWADKSRKFEKKPRANSYFDSHSADSKPAVWWNVKYKDRFLSDGSLTGGNPIFTNLLWNEIGRGADLRELSDWLDRNAQTVKELTAAVEASEAPQIIDFISETKFDLAELKDGQQTFNQRCSHCHGTYEKAWDTQPDASWKDQLRTTQVNYPRPTRVIDVGTDPARYLGMKSLERLNDLEISKRNNTTVQMQKGYVPPPLVGIWARWPYFHNNSVPSLCAVLTQSSDRPKRYWAGPANSVEKDFDVECNGYPANAPSAWKKNKEFQYVSGREGVKNSGHDEGIFLANGQELLTPQQKKNLIRFLQTL